MAEQDLTPYEGEWVAVREGRVIAHDSDPERVRAHPEVSPDDGIYPVGEPLTGSYMTEGFLGPL